MSGGPRGWRARASAVAIVLVIGAGVTACTDDPSSGSAGSDSSSPPAGTAAPAPSGGRVDQTVAPSRPPKSVDADLDEPAKASDDVTVQIAKVASIKAKAQGPGEVGGPAVAITIKIENDGSKAFDTSLLSVNVTDAKGLPGSGMIGPPAKWIKGSVKPGGQAQGVYVFSVPERNRNPIEVSVSVNPGMPTVVFSGKA